MRAHVTVDLAAVRANVSALRARAAGAGVMAVVKADGYGHGALPCARAALRGGAAWLATATPQEALELRAGGIRGPVLCWLWTPGGPWAEAIGAGIDVAAGALWSLREAAAAARATGRTARIHLKADTGLGRGGCAPADWPELVAGARAAEAEGTVKVTGVFTHMACADEPGHPSIAGQIAAFRDAVARAEAAGIEPEVRHLANSPAALTLPDATFDLVRTGLAIYGLSPVPQLGSPADFGLRPAMTFSARLAGVKRVPAGHGVSYGHMYTTEGETTLGLVPVGYADGVPRHASGTGPVLVAGKWRTAAGIVAMDQFVVDLGGDRAEAGDEAVLFGPGDDGEPTVQDWAAAAGTIAYEIVTRIGSRVPRVHVNEEPDGGGGDG